MLAATRAIIRETLPYRAADETALAPTGEYRLEDRSGCVGLCQCSGGCDFTLSIDAFQQHLAEGRIALVT